MGAWLGVATCLGWFVILGFVLTFLQWTIMAEIDWITGVMGVFVAIGLGLTMTNPPSKDIQLLCVVALYGSAVMLPIIRWSFGRRDRRDEFVQAVRKAYEGFVFRPDNPSAMLQLAINLWQLGMEGHAMTLGENAIKGLPRQYYMKEHRMVESWRQKPLSASAFEPIDCAECGTSNAPGMVHCGKCGARYLLLRVQGRAVASNLAKRLLAAWLVMMIALLGIPLASRLPTQTGLVVIFSLLAAAIGAIVLALRPTKRSA